MITVIELKVIKELLTSIRGKHLPIQIPQNGNIALSHKGRIVESGGKQLVEHLERNGYDWIKSKYSLKEEANEIGAVHS